MQKANRILLLVVLCICILSISAYAQLPTTNWPKSGRDYYNSSHSPATSIAKPVPVFRHTVEVLQGEAPALSGVTIGPDGDVYILWDDCFGLGKYSSVDGHEIWNANNKGFNTCDDYGFYNAPTIWSDGTNQRVLFWEGGDPRATIGAANVVDGSYVWETGTLNNPGTNFPSIGGYDGVACHASPAIAPDGTIYMGNMQYAWFGPYGPMKAINSDGTIKWYFNTYGQGRTLGSYAIQQVNDGGTMKNIIYSSGAVYDEDTEEGAKCLFAVRDDGGSATLLWTANYYNTGFFNSGPVLSNDGSTLYVAGRDGWPWHVENTNVTWSQPDTLFAYSTEIPVGTTEKAKKWSIKTGGSHSMSPALGSDGTIYVCGGQWRTGAKSDVAPINTVGKVIAIKDNGDNAQIKWTYELPDDVDSDTTQIATISTSPTVLYVASGNGRLFCIQDQGTYGKLLWTWQATDLKYSCFSSVGFNPPNPVVDDDGNVYITFNDQLFKFPAGFNPSSPEGISGTVKDAAGNPVVGAWVSASTSPNPLADNSSRIWTKTNPDGTYQISPDATGTYYVAAGAVGYEGSNDQTAVLNNFSDKVFMNFILGKAKFNYALASNISADSENTDYKSVNAVDGDLTTRFASTSLPANLTVDLNESRTISEAVIYWEYHCGKEYSIDYSVNGTDWISIYPTSNGNGGFPLSWYAANPDGPYYDYNDPDNGDYSLVEIGTGPGGTKVGCDVIKFAPTTARYWRVSITSAITAPVATRIYVGDYKNYKQSDIASIWDIELRDANIPGVDPAVGIGGAKNAPVGCGVKINSAVVTATDGSVPAGSIFIESADRTAGIKVNASDVSGFVFGDRVSILGKIYADVNGEKYINAISVTKLSSGAPLDALGMNNKAAAEDSAQGLFIKTWGKVSAVDTDSFTISDGSATAIKVLCGAITKPSVGDSVRVRGVAGKSDSGSVLYMRGDRCDWTTADAAYQALPFKGTYKYPNEYLVLGPYIGEQPSSTYWSDWLFAEYFPEYDFISVATAGAMTEVGLSQPKAGDYVGDKTWVKAYTSNGLLDLNSVFGGTTEHAVAYVYLNLWSEVDNPAVAITTGSDDWLRVYINGTDVRDIWQDASSTDAENNNLVNGRGCNYGDDLPLAITLHKGSNDILFKVVNNASGFGVTCQFVSAGATGTYGYGGYPAYTTTGLGYIENANE